MQSVYTGVMDKNVAIGVVITLVAVGAFMFAYGIPAGILPAGKDSQLAMVAVPFTELARGAQSTIGRRVNYLITSPGQFRELWEMVGAEGPAPDIDFSENVVVAVFAGEKPTAGYGIAVSEVEDADARTITVTLTEPGGDCVLAQVITSPYQIIQLPKTTLNLIHKDVSTTVGCSE